MIGREATTKVVKDRVEIIDRRKQDLIVASMIAVFVAMAMAERVTVLVSVIPFVTSVVVAVAA